MSKKQVRYSAIEPNFPIRVGYPCVLYPMDHDSPLVSNTKAAVTTPVVAYDETTGVVETMNTVYVPHRGCDESDS